MADPIQLTPKEKELFQRICSLASTLEEYYRNYGRAKMDTAPIYREMADKAHELHMLLKERNHEPQHHKYMLENRGMPSDAMEFYNHLHPVEDLIKFVRDPDANKDPEDVTLGAKFDFSIYTRRWGHYDHYTVTRTQNGWHFSGLPAGTGDGDQEGAPVLQALLDHDSTCYPAQIGEFFAWTWRVAEEDGLDKAAVQQALNDIAKWISECERNTPRGIFEMLR